MGAAYISGSLYFLISSLISILCFLVVLKAGGAISKFFKRRFPGDNELKTRLSFLILAYLLTTLLFLLALFNLFEAIPYLDYSYNQTAFAWSYFALGILAIFLTFLREGISRFNEWQQYRTEMEELHQAYVKSQLHALKSQVNPHFLFNSLNALSSLIQDDEAGAEKFLDEMSKVYRYMFRHNAEQLVTLETELTFLSSYSYLLQSRYGDCLQIQVEVGPEARSKWLAPLTLQVVIENAFSQNKLGKEHPLLISIVSEDSCAIGISHPLRLKSITGDMDFEQGLDNLLRKYELLNFPLVVKEIPGEYRQICIPLIEHNAVQQL